MGVPYEMFNKQFTDVNTELEKWNLRQYQEHCSRNWLESKKDELSPQEYKQLEMKLNLTSAISILCFLNKIWVIINKINKRKEIFTISLYLKSSPYIQDHPR